MTFKSLNLFVILLFCSFLFLPKSSDAQDVMNNKFGKGISLIAKDSSFSFKFGARIQTLYTGILNTDTDEYTDRFLVRRARLKFDGFAYTPKLEYKIELGLSNLDIAGGDIAQLGHASSIILDAVLKYNFYRNWTVWFGQTKLPGNIERVISSQQMQLVDRSLLNSVYNIDRDKGIQLHYEGNKFRFISSISGGEGRNITVDNAGGNDYTNRVEWLPFGQFTGKGDYSGADLKREPKPKLMLSLTYDYNDRASRQRGQLGEFMPVNRTLATWFADAHFKYNGFSTMIEYANKQTPDGDNFFGYDERGRPIAFYTGTGINIQSGYLLKNNIEFAARFTNITPDKETFRNASNQYTVGVSKYFVGHSLKIQSDISYTTEETLSDFIMYRFQVEFAL